MILKYKGTEEYLGPNFIVNSGDLVDFKDETAKLKLKQEPKRWEVVNDGNKREGSSRIRSDK